MRKLAYVIVTVCLLMNLVGWRWGSGWQQGDMDLGANDITTSGEIRSYGAITDQPLARTFTLTELRGNIYTNKYASTATVYTLPAVATGANVTFLLTWGQDIDVNPDDADTIIALTNAAGDQISSDKATGSFVTLLGINAYEWIALDSTGTWADAN